MKTSVSRLRSMPMLLLPPLSTPTRARSRCAIAPPHARLPALARQSLSLWSHKGRAAAEGFSPTSPRAHWIGPESCGQEGRLFYTFRPISLSFPFYILMPKVRSCGRAAASKALRRRAPSSPPFPLHQDREMNRLLRNIHNCVIVLHQRFNCCLMARASSALTKQPTGQTNLESSPRHRPAAGIFSHCTHTAQPSTTKVQHAHPLLANKLAGESRVGGEGRLSV